LFITAVIITLAGILLYFLLTPPADIQSKQVSNDELISESEIGSEGKLKKAIVRSIVTDIY